MMEFLNLKVQFCNQLNYFFVSVGNMFEMKHTHINTFVGILICRKNINFFK